MQKIMLVAGCSHAAGSEIDGQEDSAYNRQQSFGGLLANKLGYKLINVSQNGMTNSGIARSVLQWFYKFYNPELMEVFVLIAWTESLRLEVPSNQRIFYYNPSSMSADWFDNTANYFFRINLGYMGGDDLERELFPYYHEFMAKNEHMLELMTINYILQLQYFLQSKNCKYLMCNSMHLCTLPNKINEMYLKLIDTRYYYKLTKNEDCFFWKFKNEGYTNPKAKYWHHGEEAHRLYAEELYRFLGENDVYSSLV